MADAVELFASNTTGEHKASEDGLISVGDVYKYTESVGTSPVIFDISDYYSESTVKSKDRKIRVLTLGDLEPDKMYITAYKIEVDKVDRYFILVEQHTDTDGE